MEPIVYWNAKLTHTGVTAYKKFENCNRKMRSSSLLNLLGASGFANETLRYLIKEFNSSSNHEAKSHINDQAVELLCQEEYDIYLQQTRQARHLNPAQSRKIAYLSKKLAYYTQKRVFSSKKSGKYSMRVAFLTLTAPGDAEPDKVCRAFNRFLDYIQRTANCVYIWKKELGDESERLHFHLIINNFIPYYIISWKWKRSLLAEDVKWTTTVNGVDSNSHSRIELPRNRRQTAHYIAKYLSKAYDLPGEYGYISGHSSVLDSLKEIVLTEDEWPIDEINALKAHLKVISHDYITIICADLLSVKKIAPTIGALFEKQYIEFSERITLPQKFHYI